MIIGPGEIASLLLSAYSNPAYSYKAKMDNFLNTVDNLVSAWLFKILSCMNLECINIIHYAPNISKMLFL